jgi:hypothetical protein
LPLPQSLAFTSDDDEKKEQEVTNTDRNKYNKRIPN